MLCCDVRIVLNNFFVGRFSDVMNFRLRNLLLYAPYYGRGQHNITNGAEADDEYLHEVKIVNGE